MALNRITIDPNRMRGLPCIRDTRVTTHVAGIGLLSASDPAKDGGDRAGASDRACDPEHRRAAALGRGGARICPPMAAKEPDTAREGDIGDMRHAQAARREAARKASMSERLARVHALCKQMSAVKGAASAR
jgi:Protein of unknown function (DUF433)